METTGTKAHFSFPAIIALALAIWSIFASAGLSLILAVIAIIFGVIGLLISFSPSVRGGVTSIFSLVIAAIGIFLAVIKGIAHVF